ncbi:MAG: DUF4367 domain-containing protein [Clostridia bacterium]|nr:DUF4367 domain-containing protein [Clostridia bacterium]
MSKPSYQDQHLDLMIEMAFTQLEAEEVEQLINEPDPVLTSEEMARADRAFQFAMSRSAQQKKAEKRKERKSLVFAGLRYAATAVAAIFVLALIALPITFAASAEFRSAVMRLFVEIDDVHKEAHFSFQPADQPTQEPVAVPSVPEGWRGEYYPAYLPDGFSVDHINSFGDRIEWLKGDEAKITFFELDETAGLTSGTEGAERIEQILIQGNEGVLIVGDALNIHSVSITWAMKDHWFDLVTNGLSEDEAIRIAESVRPVNEFPAKTETAKVKPDNIPDFWPGKYYPAYIPSGFFITEYDDTFHSIEWQNDAQTRIIFSEFDENTSSMSGTEGAEEITAITIHSHDGVLIDGYNLDKTVHCVNIVWSVEDRWFEIITYSLDTDEAIRIAESVKK